MSLLQKSPSPGAASFVRMCFTLTATVALLLSPLAESSVLAQKGKAPEPTEPETRGYTIPYFVTGVALLLIVLPMCWPALRRWDLPFHGQEE